MAFGTFPSQDSEKIHANVLSKARNSCYEARDSFYECIDKESSNKPTEISYAQLRHNVECKKFRENFEKLCRPTWVKHFDHQYCAKKRVQRLLDTDNSQRDLKSLQQSSTLKS